MLYFIVSWHNKAVKAPSRHVSPFSVTRQLDVWLRSRRQLLLEIYESLGGLSPMVSPGIGSTKYNEQIKKCLADAFSSGRLVAIEVPAGEQKAKQREAIIKPKGVASQSTPGTEATSAPPNGPLGSSPKKTSQQSESSADAVTITFELTKAGKTPKLRAGTLLLSFQFNGVNVMRLILPYGDAAKLVGLKWSTSLPHEPHRPLVVVGNCALEGASSISTGSSDSSQLSLTDTVTPGPKGKIPARTRDVSSADVTLRYSVESIPLDAFQSLPGLSVALSGGGQPLKDFHHQVVLVKDGILTVVARAKSSSAEKFELSASSLLTTYYGRGDAKGYTPAEYEVLTTDGRHEVHLPLKTETLYRLVKGQNAYAVVAVEPDQGPVKQQEGEVPLMTQQELDDFLAGQGIFQIDASALQGWMSRLGSPLSAKGRCRRHSRRSLGRATVSGGVAPWEKSMRRTGRKA
ncbi:hypothetical protein ACN28S_57310 [Cystobacter fuscus]